MNNIRNTWFARLRRTFTSILHISKERNGSCVDCGDCCKLPNVCSFLRYKNRKSYCLIHSIKPLNCRKYPRTKFEFITEDSCGFRFG